MARLTKRRRAFLASVARRRRREADARLSYVIQLADRTLRLAHAEFVFLCPRCRQKLRESRIRIVPTVYGLNVQHQLPACDLWLSRAAGWRFKGYPSFFERFGRPFVAAAVLGR